MAYFCQRDIKKLHKASSMLWMLWTGVVICPVTLLAFGLKKDQIKITFSEENSRTKSKYAYCQSISSSIRDRKRKLQGRPSNCPYFHVKHAWRFHMSYDSCRQYRSPETKIANWYTIFDSYNTNTSQYESSKQMTGAFDLYHPCYTFFVTSLH